MYKLYIVCNIIEILALRCWTFMSESEQGKGKESPPLGWWQRSRYQSQNDDANDDDNVYNNDDDKNDLPVTTKSYVPKYNILKHQVHTWYL